MSTINQSDFGVISSRNVAKLKWKRVIQKKKKKQREHLKPIAINKYNKLI
jgi:hypothetical protein